MPKKSKRSQAQKLRWRPFDSNTPDEQTGSISSTKGDGFTLSNVTQERENQTENVYLLPIVRITRHMVHILEISSAPVIHSPSLPITMTTQYCRERTSTTYWTRVTSCTVVSEQRYVEGKAENHFLATDELPDIVSVDGVEYEVLKHLSRYGTLREAVPDGAEDYLNLAARLQCLSVDVNHALLTLNNVTIALFRDQSGKYGYFDPHARTPEGLPRVQFSRTTADTAVMVTFEGLGDMIEVLLEYHRLMGTTNGSKYELAPVSFIRLNRLTDDESQHVGSHDNMDSQGKQEEIPYRPKVPQHCPMPSTSITHNPRSQAAVQDNENIMHNDHPRSNFSKLTKERRKRNEKASCKKDNCQR